MFKRLFNFGNTTSYKLTQKIFFWSIIYLLIQFADTTLNLNIWVKPGTPAEQAWFWIDATRIFYWIRYISSFFIKIILIKLGCEVLYLFIKNKNNDAV